MPLSAENAVDFSASVMASFRIEMLALVSRVSSNIEGPEFCAECSGVLWDPQYL